MNRILKTSLLTLFLVASCATPIKKQSKEASSKSEATTPQAAWKKAGQNLSKIVAKAKAGGKGHVEYLATDLYIKATDASMRGDSQTASLLYKQVVELKPNDLYVKKKYAVELIRTGKLEESKSLLSEIFKKSHYSEEAIGLVLGGVYTALEDKKNARKAYKTVLKYHPKSEEACVFLSKSYGQDKQYRKAENLLNKCQKRMPKQAVFTYYKGKLAIVRGKVKLARNLFKKALKIDGEYYQAVLAYGLTYEEKEKFKPAIKAYEKFLKKNPMSYPVLSRIVQVKFATQDLKNIISYAERLSSLDTSDLNLKVRLGILYTDSKKYDDAIGIFKEVLAAVPDSDKVLYYLGSLHKETGRLEASLEYFVKIPESSSLFHESHVEMAQILQAMANKGKVDGNQEVIERFTKFINQKSDKFPALQVELKLILATWYENQRQFPQAIEAVSSVKGSKNYTEGHDYYLASLYEKNNNFSSAESLIEKILEKNPKNAHAWNFLGYSFLERGEELDKAFNYISKAVELKPEDGYIRDSLGWYYYKVGKMNLALKEIKKAWSLVKTDVVITKHLAMIYQKMSKYSLAKKYYVEALQNCKMESERSEVIQALQQLEEVRLPASE